MKTKQDKVKAARQAKKGRKGGKSQHINQAADFIDEDYINPLESSPQIFSGDLLR